MTQIKPPYSKFEIVRYETLQFLRNVPIFSEINDNELSRIARVGEIKEYKPGNVVLLEEDVGSALFVIITGKVKVVRRDDEDREVILSILSENDFFGEMAILDGLKRSASVIAITKSSLFILQQHDFLKVLHEHPSVAIALLKELTTRLRKADAQIKSLSLKDSAGKIANAILQLADDIGKIRKGRVEIDKLPRRHDFASLAGVARETLSRKLNMFVQKGHIELKGNKLIINNYENFKNLYI